MVRVVRDRGGIAVAQGERGGGLGVVRAAVGVSEPPDVGEGRSTVLALDVAQEAACADRGQLLIVADQADGSTTADHVIDSSGEVEGAGHAGLIDDEERVLVDRVEPRGNGSAGRDGMDELRECVCRDGLIAELLAEDSCRRGRRRKADDVAAARGPCVGECPHGDGLAGACGGERELHAGAGAGEFAKHRRLVLTELHAVRRVFEQGQRDGRRVNNAAVEVAGKGEYALLGGEDRGRAVPPRPSDLVHG